MKYQKTSFNSRLGFAQSNRPHFNSTYLLRVPFSPGIAVCIGDYGKITQTFSQSHIINQIYREGKNADKIN